MIQHSETAPVGSVTTLPDYLPSEFDRTSAILCRNTAPLIAFAFALLQRNVGCRVLGREIGQQLIATVKKASASSVDELIQKLENFRRREITKAIAQDNAAQCAAIEDKYDCLQLFTTQATTVAGVISSIENLFDDRDRSLLTLSTVHKAKGLEWETVYILDKDTLMPCKWAKQPWQQVQETNLIYVAVTRAKLHLKYISSGCWKQQPAAHTQCAEQPESTTPLVDMILAETDAEKRERIKREVLASI